MYTKMNANDFFELPGAFKTIPDMQKPRRGQLFQKHSLKTCTNSQLLPTDRMYIYIYVCIKYTESWAVNPWNLNLEILSVRSCLPRARRKEAVWACEKHFDAAAMPLLGRSWSFWASS